MNSWIFLIIILLGEPFPIIILIRNITQRHNVNVSTIGNTIIIDNANGSNQLKKKYFCKFFFQ